MPWGAIDIVGACLCWGIDSNLTCKAPASDASQISALKGLVASSVNPAISLALGYTVPLSARSHRGTFSNAMAR
ncbi:hypothetical protein D9M09_12825 [Janthinobacterium agaricidamnosum]|uniref:Uncharacterized protein n=1 Tax=Janthinobacterium agaricidamnosum TaxID=55508 RepID=A0A3G2E921_9BURK|nr:hypothetical protein D9M09_12825 [Janthinobacterium agaricidamnosum]